MWWLSQRCCRVKCSEGIVFSSYICDLCYMEKYVYSQPKSERGGSLLHCFQPKMIYAKKITP